MKFSVKEIYHTIQGEGARSGRAAIFCRFSGCNLWSGLEQHRKSAVCNFCDTDFNGVDGENGGKFETAGKLSSTIESLWIDSINDDDNRYVIFTGGEPGLQINEELVSSLQTKKFEVAIETNGTVALPKNLDWITVSPKTRNPFMITKGSELKFVFPQEKLTPEMFKSLDFKHFYIQPKFDDHYRDNLRNSIEFCLKYPKWKLSLQSHKYLGIV